MSSSWGDSRTGFRFGKTEIWVDANDVDELWKDTMDLVHEIKAAHDLMPDTEAMKFPRPAAGLT